MKKKLIAALLCLTLILPANQAFAMDNENSIQQETQDTPEPPTTQTTDNEPLEEIPEESTALPETTQSDSASTSFYTQNLSLDPVTGLTAQSAGKGKIKLSWNTVDNAEGYIIYRKTGNEKAKYIMMTSGTSRIDTSASGTEYNFYFVYPYYTQDNKRVICTANASYVYAKAALPEAGNPQTARAGKNKVKLTWNKVNDADGYIIYKRSNGTFKYTGMTGQLSYTDTKASGSEYNFYKIYPYYKENGKNVVGTVQNYVYAKAGLSAVTNLKAQNIKKTIKLTWGKVKDADGYIIYRREGNGSFKYLYMKDSTATSFVDTKCTGSEYNFYRVYPYYNDSTGKRVLGSSDKYVYSYIRLDAVTSVSAEATDYATITVKWNKTYGAEGYYIIKQTGSNDPVVYDFVDGSNNCTYIDKNASLTEYNTYGIMPCLVDGQNNLIYAPVQTTTGPVQAVAATPYKITGKAAYSQAYKVLNLVNAERKKAGLNALTMDKDLMEAAMQRSAELVFLFDHTRPSGLSCFTVSDKAYSENIAMGTLPYFDSTQIMNGWMNSKGHRENILRNGFTTIGIGCFEYNGVGYWVQLFGTNTTTAASQPTDKTITKTVLVYSQKSTAVQTFTLDENAVSDNSKEKIDDAATRNSDDIQLPEINLEQFSKVIDILP